MWFIFKNIAIFKFIFVSLNLKKKNGGLVFRFFFLLFLLDNKNRVCCLCNVIVLILIILVTFHVISIDQRFNALFQIGRLQKEKGQINNFSSFISMWKLTFTGNVNCLYSSLMSKLWLSVFRIFIILTIAASIWYCLSWYTRSSVAFCSSVCYKKKRKKIIIMFLLAPFSPKIKLRLPFPSFEFDWFLFGTIYWWIHC